MKTFILATTAAIALASPVLAEGDGSRYHGDTSNGDVAYVLAHFAQDREGGDGPRVLISEVSDVVISTSNDTLASYAASKLDNGERGDN